MEIDALIREAGRIVVVTGAGISVASGLPTFRGDEPDAIWSRDVTEIATRHWFTRHPVEWWQWFLRAFEKVPTAEPNAAHRALAELERWQIERGRKFLVVTQNIDTLHEQAGSRELVKVHGTWDRVRCTREGCGYAAPEGSLPLDRDALDRFLDDPRVENLPRCPDCSAVLRAHALLFDEYYDEHVDYDYVRVCEGLLLADLVLFVGTSFSVGVTELAVRTAQGRGIPTVSIDPVGTPPRGVTAIRDPAEVVLPEIVARLG
ncbi:MAG TPA: Sir2 family NAD-dependent protein deacetylase [Thermoanaerobaculia bacterium]|nr:Sir2 family NAD-dependent protein deacetylase [Thermoanaerobaculia bacterium]